MHSKDKLNRPERSKLYRALKYLPAIIWTVIIIFLTIQPSPNQPMLFQNFDKVLHFGAFALLSTLAYYAVSGAYPLISTILIPSVVGGLVEYFQSKLPYRKASIADFIADLAGCITVFLAFALYRRYCASREHRHRN